VMREVNGYTVQEIQAISYPFFVDVRGEGLNSESALTSGLTGVTMAFSSPVIADGAAAAGRTVETLLSSSAMAWTQTTTNIQPDFEQFPELGFVAAAERQSYPLAVMVQGSFQSAFAGQESPLLQPDEPVGDEAPAPTPEFVPSTVEVSPESARLVVFGSAEFADDVILQISAALSRDRYVNSLMLLQNTVAYATEDIDLLEISARGTYTRALAPLDEGQQSFWEGVNYVLALLALLALALYWTMRRRRQEPMVLLSPSELADEEVSS